MLKVLKNIILDVTEFVFPRHCFVCNEKISAADFDILCRKCMFSIPIAPERDVLTNQLIKNIGREELSITNAISLLSREDERYMQLIYNLKYQGFRKIGYQLGRKLGDLIAKESLPKYDLILPVPIHRAKFRERGYNQSDTIAKGVGEALGVDYDLNFAMRSKYTISQTLMSSEQRKHNVRNVFAIQKGKSAEGKTMLLVDDVLTTGSTLNSLADMLMHAGANQIDVATLLKA